MFKPTKIYPRDIIAIITLLACFTLMALGINHLVSGIIIMVITFYFARRMDGEGEPGKDINEKVKKLENKINYNQSTPQLPQNVMTPNQLSPPVIVKPIIPSQ